MSNQASAGLYRKDSWAIVAHGSGHRMAISREQYEQEGHTPQFDSLQSEDDYNEYALGRRFGDND